MHVHIHPYLPTYLPIYLPYIHTGDLNYRMAAPSPGDVLREIAQAGQHSKQLTADISRLNSSRNLSSSSQQPTVEATGLTTTMTTTVTSSSAVVGAVTTSAAGTGKTTTTTTTTTTMKPKGTHYTSTYVTPAVEDELMGSTTRKTGMVLLADPVTAIAVKPTADGDHIRSSSSSSSSS